jgi:hypothetical protein
MDSAVAVAHAASAGNSGPSSPGGSRIIGHLKATRRRVRGDRDSEVSSYSSQPQVVFVGRYVDGGGAGGGSRVGAHYGCRRRSCRGGGLPPRRRRRWSGRVEEYDGVGR